MKTRICKNGHNCVHGAIPLPLDKEHFWTDKRAAGGFRETCKACTLVKKKATIKAIKEEEKSYAEETAESWNENADPIGDELRRLRGVMDDKRKSIESVSEGDSIILKVKGFGSGSRASVHQCKLIGKYRSVFTVDFGTYRESFPIADLVCGHVELEAVGQG